MGKEFQNKFYLRGDTGLSVNRSLDAAPHSHYALQITLALEAPFRLRIQKSEWEEHSALLIESTCRHQYGSQGRPQAIILLNPLSRVGHSLRRKFTDGGLYARLPQQAGVILRDALLGSPDDNERVLDRMETYLAELLSGAKPEYPEIPEKVALALDIMNDLTEMKISLEKLARKANISESYLTHQFKKSVGIPIRRHLMWLKTLAAVRYLVSGRGNLTMAAHEAGFADQAHFSRTFKLMFGISPGEFMKYHESK